MAEKKKQHIIPECYLRAWCDPITPRGHQPFIWKISKTGVWVTKRSPEKSFRETDKYTIRLPNGKRNLLIEDTLGEIETNFIRVLPKVRKRQRLSASDRAHLCVFAAAMHSRTKSMGIHWTKQMNHLHEVVLDMEQAPNVRPGLSQQTGRMVELAHQQAIANSLEFEPPLLFQMEMAILITDDVNGFITSDRPCVWFNPSLYKLPPIYRHPGLGQREIEVTLPLTPHHMLFISHTKCPEYVELSSTLLDDSNRLTRFYCSEEFVSWKGAVLAHWFGIGEKSADADLFDTPLVENLDSV